MEIEYKTEYWHALPEKYHTAGKYKNILQMIVGVVIIAAMYFDYRIIMYGIGLIVLFLAWIEHKSYQKYEKERDEKRRNKAGIGN